MRRTLYQKWASRSRLKSVRFKRNAEEIRKRFGRNPDETQMKFRRAPPKHELRFLYRKEFDSNERPLISGVLMHKISWSKKSGNHHVLISQLIEPDAIKHLAFLKLRRLQGARTVEWKFGSIFFGFKISREVKKANHNEVRGWSQREAAEKWRTTIGTSSSKKVERSTKLVVLINWIGFNR